MDSKDINKLVEIRKFVIEKYGMLDGRGAPATSIIKQADVAYVYENIISSIDRILSEHVNFES
jgi:hypothetical protein